MKSSIAAALVILLALPAGGVAPRTPVLVELFTSEGCSSCPPADALLARLLRDQPVPGAEVVAVAFHVDYWNRLGWKDPFSSKEATARQQWYAQVFGGDRVYTPQMVVNGREEFVGSDETLARKAIDAAVGRPQLPIRVTARQSQQIVRLFIDLPPAPADSEPVDVHVALVEDNLKSVVRRGENSGRTLSHVGVVRRHEVSGALSSDAFMAEGQYRIEPGWTPTNMSVVVWLQGQKTRHVFGVKTVPVTSR